MSYTRAMVEELLPGVWDSQCAYGMTPQLAPPPNMPKAQSDKASSNTLYAMLADVRQAYELSGIGREIKQALYCGYWLGISDASASLLTGVPRSTMQYRREAGVSHLTNWLNGQAYNTEEDSE